MALASGDSTLFEDHFTITAYDQSKYDRVARITAISQDSQTAISLDINIELYPMVNGEHFTMMLASTLSLDGNKDDLSKGWREVGNESTLADMWDYVCHGKIYKFEDADDGQIIKCFSSFGGLLLAMEGPYKKLTPLRVDYVYMLLKK